MSSASIHRTQSAPANAGAGSVCRAGTDVHEHGRLQTDPPPAWRGADFRVYDAQRSNLTTEATEHTEGSTRREL